MKAGMTVRIRIAPVDVMGVIDIVDKLDLYVPGMSFSQTVSIALRALLEAARHQDIIPTRDGFEYLEMTKRYPSDGPTQDRVRGRQLQITEAFEAGLGESNRIRGLVGPEDQVAQARQNRIWNQIEQLQALKDAAEVEGLGNWSEQQEAELKRLTTLV